jgi:hydroxymethylglutaryl-CoA lyase
MSAKHAILRDVTLRDGLQSLPEILPTADKLAILDALIDGGVRELQVTSFVNPARVPQLADAETMYARCLERGVSVNVLVANPRGFERARAAGVRSVDAVLSVSDAYNRKNANRSSEESAREVDAIIAAGAEAGIEVGIGIANCFHCFTEGQIDADRAFALARRFAEGGAGTIWLADTTGHAYPEAVAALTARCQGLGARIGLHLHDTEGRAIANALAGFEAGAILFDAALGGIGGSPFTPGVGGNLSLEGAVDAFAVAGIETGLAASRLAAARRRLAAAIEAARA